MKKNLKTGARKIKECEYKSLVRPVLGYPSTVCDPHLQKDFKSVEAIQGWVARFVLNKYHYTDSVDDVLCTLNRPSLEQRRETARLAIFFSQKS